MFSWSCFRKEGVERIVVMLPNGFISGHCSIWLNTMFKAIEFPTGIAHLDASLANMNA